MIMENKKKQIIRTVIILFIAVGVAGYFYYQNKIPQPDYNKQGIVIEKQERVTKKNNEGKQKSHLQTSNPIAEYKASNHRAAQNPVEEFMNEYINAATEETDATEVVMDTPGYAAFRIDPGNRGDVPETAENLARIYFEMFPDEERIRISLLIGGGVRGARTYKRDDVMQDENY
jgi:uncharacterized protein YxeA